MTPTTAPCPMKKPGKVGDKFTDKQRLDWLTKNKELFYSDQGVNWWSPFADYVGYKTPRACIDAAMKAAIKQGRG